MTTLDPGRLARLAELLEERFGIGSEPGREDALADLVLRRVAHRRFGDVDAYLAHLESGADADEEFRALAQGITVGETYFFRYRDHFEAFRRAVLPARIRARAAERRLRILSAGCATGEEPYTLAIAVRDGIPDLARWDVSIVGADVNPAFLEKARRGRYGQWSLREARPEEVDRHFRKEGHHWQLDSGVRSMVRFEERNLAQEAPGLWERGAFDVVFCRNVLIYFGPRAIQGLLQRIEDALAPGGYLFLGHSETLRGLTHGFELCHTHDTFYYRRRAEPGQEALVQEPPDAPADRPGDGDGTALWEGVIGHASRRIRDLARGTPAHGPTVGSPAQPDLFPADAPVEAPGRAGEHLEEILDRVRAERFAEAVDLLRRLPSDVAGDTDVQLVLAVALTGHGALDEAEEICRRILEEDGLNPGAHYVVALCREQAGDLEAAERLCQASAYLDPTFALPRLHLGRLARRSGRHEAARRELRQALSLMEREDASRILLFGGGFSREALGALCRAELRAAEGGG